MTKLNPMNFSDKCTIHEMKCETGEGVSTPNHEEKI